MLCPPMVQRSGRFKTTHTGWYLSAKAYRAACDELSRVVRRFETALYGALFRGQSKKRYLHALFHSEFLRRTGNQAIPNVELMKVFKFFLWHAFGRYTWN